MCTTCHPVLAIFYLFNCFTTELPWASCDHYWNTENCVDFQRNGTNFTFNPKRHLTCRRVLGTSCPQDLQWD
ncbi:hypothetical protein J4Q44_G00077790 [Coregonus suidteri]|uniref:Secreted protein n=1 Tax=Coregonus suidteri TaxID=861788 RepID=A0AAN8LXU3_9TELE